MPKDAESNYYKKIPNLDLVMLSMYRRESFGDIFDNRTSTYSSVKMPLVVSEFGRSSVSGNGAGTDSSQLQLTTLEKLWNELNSRLNTMVAGALYLSLMMKLGKGIINTTPL